MIVGGKIYKFEEELKSLFILILIRYDIDHDRNSY